MGSRHQEMRPCLFSRETGLAELTLDAQVVAEEKRAGRHPGDLPRSYRADAVPASERLQQGVRDG